MKGIVALAAVFVSLSGSAQLKGFSLGPYVEAGWPAAKSTSLYKTGYGGGLGADIKLGRLGLTGSVGIMHFGPQTSTGENGFKVPAINAVPIRAGIKYRLAPAIYAKVESGIAKMNGGEPSAVIFAPGLAIRLLGLELQGKYELWQRERPLHFWGLKAGFNF